MNPDPDDVTFQFNQIQLTDKDADSVSQSKVADVSFGFNQVHANGDSKLVESTPENDDVEKSPEKSPENADVDSGDDDVTFASSQVRISNSKEMKPEDADVDDEDDDVTFGFSQEGDDVEGEEFTFMCINSDNTVTELTEKTVFPLFDQSLLHNSFNNNNINNEDGKRINVPVNNVFIESPRASRADTSSSSSSSSTTLTAITDSNEMNIKSNSTGFSKLWRFRDNNNINRSNSDGRDAFVFLNNPKTKEGGFLNNAKTEGKGKGKGKEVNVVVKKKVKKANVASAHEVYLKQKGGEEELKRKSYLPYRPGLMGFFTNVNGGLSKNVHPF